MYGEFLRENRRADRENYFELMLGFRELRRNRPDPWQKGDLSLDKDRIGGRTSYQKAHIRRSSKIGKKLRLKCKYYIWRELLSWGQNRWINIFNEFWVARHWSIFNLRGTRGMVSKIWDLFLRISCKLIMKMACVSFNLCDKIMRLENQIVKLTC